jgi:arsenical pump membrane protein
MTSEQLKRRGGATSCRLELGCVASGFLRRLRDAECVTDPIHGLQGVGAQSSAEGGRRAPRLSWAFAAFGMVAATVGAILDPAAARSSADQNWSPFVLVAGLLLIGLVADDDGLFAAAGNRLARSLRNGVVLFVGAVVTIGLVTALLNLDTSVAFLTPVLVYTARQRGEGEAPLLYGCLLLSNAGSLFLPGSNLTNLIVLGHLHLTGGEFFGHMWVAALAALVTTAAVVGVVERRSLRATVAEVAKGERPVFGVGLVAVGVATVLVVLLRHPAPFVAAVGMVAVGIRVVERRDRAAHVVSVLGVPVLVGLFGLAVALGTVGRAWSGPVTLLSRLNVWGTAVLGALAAVLVNNLPAASLLAAHPPEHPFALLVGLNVGPNLFVTGSLAWILWFRAARRAGARPTVAKAARLGVLVVPVSMIVAIAALTITGPR